jgi:hypothetical protein
MLGIRFPPFWADFCHDYSVAGFVESCYNETRFAVEYYVLSVAKWPMAASLKRRRTSLCLIWHLGIAINDLKCSINKIFNSVKVPVIHSDLASVDKGRNR